MSLALGTLVVHEPMPHWRVAWFLFVVVGDAKPDHLGRPQQRVLPLSRFQSWQKFAGVTGSNGGVALVTDLSPISDYGMVLKRLVLSGDSECHGNEFLEIEADPAITPKAKKPWGSRPHPKPWLEGHSTISEPDVGLLIRAAHFPKTEEAA